MSNTIQNIDNKPNFDSLSFVKHQTAQTEVAPVRTNSAEPVNDPKKFLEVKSKVGSQLESNYKQIEAAIEDIRKMADDNLMNLGFTIDRKINTHIVTVTDLNTGKVIRQIPDEVVVRVARNLADFKGLLMDKKL
jgi:flagellar protein FlaG